MDSVGETIGGIIQARMGSQRLPGKTLRPVAGKPLLQYLLERVSRCRHLSALIVATSRESLDDPIAAFCREWGVTCQRGSVENVASRFHEVLARHKLAAFVRINGDSPLLDQGLIERGIEIYRGGGFDMVTNVSPRTFPSGQSVEIVSAEVFNRAFALMTDPEDLEHVTRFFYRDRQGYRIFNFEAEEPFDGVHLAVDTEKDLKVFAAIVEKMTKPHWEYDLKEIARLYAELS